MRNDILLHDFLKVDKGEKVKAEQWQSKRNGMANSDPVAAAVMSNLALPK